MKMPLVWCFNDFVSSLPIFALGWCVFGFLFIINFCHLVIFWHNCLNDCVNTVYLKSIPMMTNIKIGISSKNCWMTGTMVLVKGWSVRKCGSLLDSSWFNHDQLNSLHLLLHLIYFFFFTISSSSSPHFSNVSTAYYPFFTLFYWFWFFPSPCWLLALHHLFLIILPFHHQLGPPYDAKLTSN